MRAPRIVEETRHLPITLLANPEDLEVARMVTRRAIVRDAIDLGKGTLAEAFERQRMHVPQHLPIRFLNLPIGLPCTGQCKCNAGSCGLWRSRRAVLKLFDKDVPSRTHL